MAYVHNHDAWFEFLLNVSVYVDSLISNAGNHSRRVADLVRSTARRLRCPESEIRIFYLASLLHDVGKIGVPEQVLSKAGPLTRREWREMKLHPVVGSNIVKSMNGLSDIAPIVYYHQEKYDGTGYPNGIRGDRIPLGARILAVADAYDAMTTDRYYRKARSFTDATFELMRMAGRDFDPFVVDAFLDVIYGEGTYEEIQ